MQQKLKCLGMRKQKAMKGQKLKPGTKLLALKLTLGDIFILKGKGVGGIYKVVDTREIRNGVAGVRGQGIRGRREVWVPHETNVTLHVDR